MSFKHSKVLVVAFCLLLGISLTACHKQATTPKTNKIQVVSSVNFYGDVAKQVGGKNVHVTSIINSNVDSHDFEPTINNSKEVSKADVVIANGIGYDDWMDNLIKTAGNKKQTDINVGALMGKHEGDNEHIWYNPQTMNKLANHLADTYSKKDPKHRKQYQQNAKKYQQKWAKTTNLIKQIKTKSHGQKVAVSEPVFDYALEPMGYHVINNSFSQAIENGVDPSAKDIKKLQHAIKNHQITFFVSNVQSSDPVVVNIIKLAKQNHIPIINVSETQPEHKNYNQWMQNAYQQVLNAQNKKTSY